MKKLVTLLTIVIIQSSCIGDAYVTTNYKIKNKTSKTIYVKGNLTTPNPDRKNQSKTYIIRPNTNNIVKIKKEICGFGNCKILISNPDNFQDIIIFKDSLLTDTVNIQLKDWKIKRKKAVLSLKN